MQNSKNKNRSQLKSYLSVALICAMGIGLGACSKDAQATTLNTEVKAEAPTEVEDFVACKQPEQMGPSSTIIKLMQTTGACVDAQNEKLTLFYYHAAISRMEMMIMLSKDNISQKFEMLRGFEKLMSPVIIGWGTQNIPNYIIEIEKSSAWEANQKFPEIESFIKDKITTSDKYEMARKESIQKTSETIIYLSANRDQFYLNRDKSNLTVTDKNWNDEAKAKAQARFDAGFDPSAPPVELVSETGHEHDHEHDHEHEHEHDKADHSEVRK